MAAEKPDKKKIFNSAAEITDPEERVRYLDGACGGNSQLRAEIDDLLKHDVEAGSFLISPAVDVAAAGTIELPITEKPGTVIGPYKLLQQIGEGGMGVVYMAEQKEPVKRRVALKIIKAGMDTRQVIARFEAERQALAMMDHPNIARVLDAGSTESGRPYFVMELVNGIPVTQYCDQQHLTPKERLELFIPVCQAVQHAHQKGIIHRDLKPSNVLVALYDSRAVPKVIDFGVAKAASQSLTEKTMFTQLGQIVGTLEYMSPEQAQRNQLDIDTRSDVYSLGVLLYELLTGETPFDGERLRSAAFDEMLRIIREEEPRRPSLRLSGSLTLPSIAANRKIEPKKLSTLVRGELDWIVMKALEKDRTRRYETANGLAADIQRYLEDEPVEACPPSTSYRFRRFVRRNKTAFLVAAVVVVALVGGAGVATWQSVRATLAWGREQEARQTIEEQHAEVKDQRDEARRQKEEATRQRAVAERNLYRAHMHLAQFDWQSGQIGRLHEMLDDHLPETDGLDLRGWEWYYYSSLCHTDLLTLIGHQDSVLCVDWRPDGQQIASVSPDGRVNIWNVDTGQLAVTFRARSGARKLAWNPDGKRLASAGSDNKVIVYDASTGNEVLALEGHIRPINAVAWCPDGNRLASGEMDGTIKIWDSVTGQEMRSLRVRHTFSLDWSPDGRKLASGHMGEVTIWDADTWRKDVSWWAPSEIFAIAWSPDGKRVAAGSFMKLVQVWDAETKHELWRIPHLTSVESVGWSPDGKYLASATRSQRIRIWDAGTGAEVVTLRGHKDWVLSIAWSPDGKTLASGGRDRTVKVWEPLSNRTPLIMDHGGPCSFAWSPEGRRIVSLGDGKMTVWDSEMGKPMLCIEREGSEVTWSPDGSQLAVQRDARTIAVLSAESGKELLTFQTVCRIHHGWQNIAWDPQSKRLAIAVHDGSVELFDRANGKRLPTLRGPQGIVYSVAWSPKGDCLAAGSYDGTVRLWKAATGRNLLTLRGHVPKRWISALAWSPDGTRLASGGWDQVVKVWDVFTGEELQSMRGHSGALWALAWSPDGNRLASAGWDGTVKIWDVASGQEMLSLAEFSGTVSELEWSPDGRRLAASGDGIVKVWDASRGYEYASSPSYHLERAQLLAAGGNLDQAIAILEYALTVGFDSPDYRRELARTYLYRGVSRWCEDNPDKAISDLTKAVHFDPQYAEAFNLRGTAYQKLHDWDQAIADYEEAIVLAPKLVAAYRNRANAYASLEQWEKAREDLDVAVRLAEDWDDLHRVVLLRLIAGNHAGYLLACRQMLDRLVSTDNTDAFSVTAWTCALAPYAVADFTAPLRLASQAAERQPNSMKAITIHGAILYRAGRFEEAIERLSAGSAMEDTQEEWQGIPAACGWFFLAMAHHRLKNVDEAKKWFDRAVEWSDRVADGEPYGNSAKLAWDRRLILELLRTEANALLGRAPDAAADFPVLASAQGHFSRARAHMEAGAFDEAVAEYSEAIRLKPEAVEYHFSRAEAYEKVGDIEQALADYTEAIRLDSTYAQAYARRSILHAQKYDAAIAGKLAQLPKKPTSSRRGEIAGDRLATHLENLVLRPQNAYYIEPYHCFEPTADLKQAVDDFLEFLRLDPTLPDYRRAALANVYVEGGNLRLAKGNAEAAIRDYTEAIRVHDGDARAFCGRGIAHFRLGHFDQALADCLEAIRLEPNNALYEPDCLLRYFAPGELSGERMDGTTFASDMPWVSASSGWTDAPPYRNRSRFGATARLAGRPCNKFLYLCARADDQPADIVFDISSGDFRQFKADVGPAFPVWHRPGGSVEFQVLVDGDVKDSTGVLRGGEVHAFRVDVAGAEEVILRLLNGGDGNDYDAAAWGNPRFLEADADDPLEPSLSLRPGNDPADWLFAAMLYAKLNNREKAEHWRQRAEKWIKENDAEDAQLRDMQAKAQELIDAIVSAPEDEPTPSDPEDAGEQ